MTWFRIVLWVLTTAALGLPFQSVPGEAAEQSSTTPTVYLLEKDANPRIPPGPPPPYLDVLEKMGLVVGFPDPHKTVPLTWETLRRYPVLFLSSGPWTDDPGEDDPGRAGTRPAPMSALLDRYLAEGGGILYIGMSVASNHEEHDRFNRWLSQYGAEFEWATVEDEEHTYQNPPPVPWQLSQYLWTTNLAPSPLTEGVKTLYFPNRTFWAPAIRPLKVSADWQVVVRTMPTATVWSLTRPVAGPTVEKVEGSARTGAAPLLAVREVGKGRIALFGADPGPFYYDLGKPVGAQVASVRGDGQTPSDWLPLLRNLCRWLSEPARQAGFPGGATERAEFYVNPEYGSREPIDWERPDLSWPDAEIHRLYGLHAGPWDVNYWRAAAAGEWQPFKFLVGAHSQASGGQGTVAEWKAAALREGFDGVIFREPILEMTPAQWEAFEAECRAACDDRFLAIPGQEFLDWIGNRFLRFQPHTPYPLPERLTPDRKRVKDQLAFFFDAGWPANLPLTPQQNPTAFWNYRVYSGYPIAVYQNGRQIEDHRADWHALVDRMEYPTPLGVHLLESPAEVAGTGLDFNLILLAPSLADIRDHPRWTGGAHALGTAIHNVAVAYASNGPVIEAFLPLNHYRATLGSREVLGSYRYRILLRARSDVPLKVVELWGGGQCLRRYRPTGKRFLATVEEQHDRQRGLLLRVVDTQGREALATSIMVHDKMMVWYWCGDHVNALPYGQGVDEAGHPTGLGLATHVKGQFAPAPGPGGTFSEAWDYIPWGTDTSLPGLNTWGEVSFVSPAGPIPAPHVWLVPDLHFWYANKDLLITRQAVDRWANRDQYVPQEQPTINGWYPYVRTQPTEDFDVVADDIDFHRDAGQPSLQLCRGEVRFKRDVTLSDQEFLNVVLVRLGWNTVKQGLYTAAGKLAQPGRLQEKLGQGNYVTWPADLGHGTIFALDDDFAAVAEVDAAGQQAGRPTFGYALGGRTFRKGEVFRYAFLLMRWPVGTNLEERLDAKVQQALHLAAPETGARLTAIHGQVLGTQGGKGVPPYLDLAAQDGVFRGHLARGDFGLRVPVRLRGLNPNWTAGFWRPGERVFKPFGNDPDGFAWTSVDPARDAGPIFLGNVLTCEQPEVLLRLFQRRDGGWEVLAHNPLPRTVAVTVRGSEGGPVAGLSQSLSLAPGEEVRWTASRFPTSSPL